MLRFHASLKSAVAGAAFVFAALIFLPAYASTCGSGLPGNANTRINPDRPSQETFNAAVVHYMNAERCRRGLAPFALDSGLLKAAATHSRNMAADENFSHKSRRAGQQTMAQRINGAGVRASTMGENIAMDKLFAIIGRPISTKSTGRCQFYYVGGDPVPMHSYKSLAQQVVARFMSSSKHRTNILNPRFVRGATGIGIDQGGAACGDVYITQDFAS